MIRRTCVYLLGALLVAIAASCSSTRPTAKSPSVGGLSGVQYVEDVIAHTPVREALTAKMSLSLLPPGKAATTLSGTLRMKRGEVIQLSVTPILGIEVARMEISPDRVLVVDRMHKRYVEASFAELKELANVDLDFHILQALFFNELFLPSRPALTARDASSFSVQPQGETVVLGAKASKRFTYTFFTSAVGGELQETRIGLGGTDYALDWKYGEFRSLDQASFPSFMHLVFEGGKAPVSAKIGLSRLGSGTDWETRTEVPRKYKRVALAELLEQLIK